MYRHLFVVVILVGLLNCITPCYSQPFPMIHYTTENGLPSNTVYDVYKDSKGFLWFGTDKGITRYNGIRFETFTTFDGLPDNEVFCIREDNQHRLWLLTYTGGVCYYDKGVFHTAQQTPLLQWPFPHTGIAQLTLESDSSITVNFDKEGFFVNIYGQEFSTHSLNEMKAKAGISSLIYLRKMSGSTYELAGDNKKVWMDTTYQILKTTNNPFPSPYYYFIGQQGGYIATTNGVYTLDGTLLQENREHQYTKGNIKHFYQDHKNTLTGTHDHGLIINDNTNILKDAKITGIAQDPAEHYWVSTLQDGVWFFSRNFSGEKAYKNLYEGAIKHAFLHKETLYYTTTDNNLYRLQQRTSSCIFNYSKHQEQPSANFDEPGYLADDQGGYHCLYGKDHYEIDAWNNKMPVPKHTSIFANDAPDTLKNIRNEGTGIKYIFSTPTYIYLLQGGYRIIRIDPKRTIRTGTTWFEDTGLNSSRQRIYAMAKDVNQSIWYNTIDSMFKVVNQKAVYQPAFKNKAFKYFTFIDSSLIGFTHKNELLICHNLNGKMKADTVTDRSCIWNRMYVLDNRHVLISTNNRYRILTLSSGKDTLASQLKIVEDLFVPLQAEYIVADTASCYFFKAGTVTGFTINQLLKTPEAPTPILKYLNAGKVVYVASEGKMEVPYAARRHIRLGVTALSFNSKRVIYEYSVSKGYAEDNWLPLKQEDMLLPVPGYGDYTLKVRCRSTSSKYSQPLVMRLTVGEPFWMAWWFMLLAGSMIISLLWSMARYRMGYVMRKRERAHAAEIKFLKSEYKALNALMNPHFIFNSLNNIQGLINEDDKRSANEYLRVFSSLIRQNMHNVSKELIPLQKEIDLVVNYLKFEKLRFSDCLNYAIDINDNVDLDGILIPPLLIQPLLENSIQHGLLPRRSADNMLNLRIYENEAMLYIVVMDNGIGIQQSRKNARAGHTSFALDNIEKRLGQLRLMHGRNITLHFEELTDSTDAILGTTATISIEIG